MKSISLSLLGTCFLAFAIVRAALPEGAAASVNGEAIPEKLVQTFIKNNCEALGIDRTTEEGKQKIPKVRAAVLDELIDRTLIAQETKKRGIVPTETELDAAEKTMIEYLGDEPHFADFLKLNGFNRAEYREFVLRNSAAGKALSASLTKDVIVSDQEVRDYYDAHKTEAALQWPERVTASHIFLNARPNILREQLKATHKLTEGPELEAAVSQEIERKRTMAEKIRAEAVEPQADFAELAQQYSEDPGTRSQGGNLGIFAMGTHAAELDKVAFATVVGQVGPVAHSDSGFHVVKVFEHKPAGPRTFDEASGSIRQQLTRTEQAERLKDWLAEARKAAAIIIVNPATETSAVKP